MNILLIQTAFIGDVILTTPMLAALKQSLPGAKLTVLVKPEAGPLLRVHPMVDEIITIDKRGKERGLSGMIRFIARLQKKHFDVLLSPHRSFRTAFISMLSGIPVRVGYVDASLARLAYNHRLNSHREDCEIIRLLWFVRDTLDRVLPGNPGNLEPRSSTHEKRIPSSSFHSATGFSTDMILHETEESSKKAGLIVKPFKNNRPVLVAVSSVWATKRWTPEGFARLIALIHEKWKTPVLLVGSPADRNLSDHVINLYSKLNEDSSEKIKKALPQLENLCGKTDLITLYSLMRRSRAIVSNDSAPVHVACAARKPVVAIFGPTVTTHGYAPITPESRVAQIHGLYCRPCGTHGAKRCPEKHFHCMKMITPDYVFGLLEEVDQGTK